MAKLRYGPATLQRIRAAVEAGKTRAQIARGLKITVRALYDLAKKHPEIEEAFAAKPSVPDKYNSTIPHQVLYMVAVGNKTIAEMAAELGINEETWYEWLKKHPDFAKAAESGTRAVLGRVTESMIDRATKQTTVIEKDVKYQIKKNPDFGKVPGAEEYITVPYEEIRKHKIHLPDMVAGKYLLANRDRENWNNDDPKPQEPPKKEPSDLEKKWIEILKEKDPQSKLLLDKMQLERPDIFMRYRRTQDPTELLQYIKELDEGGAT